MLVKLLVLSTLVSVIALLYARWEYGRRGKLSLFGLLLVCLMLFVPNMIIHYASDYALPTTALDYFGVLVSMAGLALCLSGIGRFRSIAKMLCLNTGQLTLTGPYRWSRNPQYIGWVLFLLGWTLNDWSLWCFAALLVVAVSLHLLVLVEEEHLQQVFGEPYIQFCRRVPRYFSWSSSTIDWAASDK